LTQRDVEVVKMGDEKEEFSVSIYQFPKNGEYEQRERGREDRGWWVSE
jgi:hypothetical protein